MNHWLLLVGPCAFAASHFEVTCHDQHVGQNGFCPQGLIGKVCFTPCLFRSNVSFPPKIRPNENEWPCTSSRQHSSPNLGNTDFPIAGAVLKAMKATSPLYSFLLKEAGSWRLLPEILQWCILARECARASISTYSQRRQNGDFISTACLRYVSQLIWLRSHVQLSNWGKAPLERPRHWCTMSRRTGRTQ